MFLIRCSPVAVTAAFLRKCLRRSGYLEEVHQLPHRAGRGLPTSARQGSEKLLGCVRGVCECVLFPAKNGCSTMFLII